MEQLGSQGLCCPPFSWEESSGWSSGAASRGRPAQALNPSASKGQCPPASLVLRVITSLAKQDSPAITGDGQQTQEIPCLRLFPPLGSGSNLPKAVELVSGLQAHSEGPVVTWDTLTLLLVLQAGSSLETDRPTASSRGPGGTSNTTRILAQGPEGQSLPIPEAVGSVCGARRMAVWGAACEQPVHRDKGLTFEAGLHCSRQCRGTPSQV